MKSLQFFCPTSFEYPLLLPVYYCISNYDIQEIVFQKPILSYRCCGFCGIICPGTMHAEYYLKVQVQPVFWHKRQYLFLKDVPSAAGCQGSLQISVLLVRLRLPEGRLICSFPKNKKPDEDPFQRCLSQPRHY